MEHEGIYCIEYEWVSRQKISSINTSILEKYQLCEALNLIRLHILSQLLNRLNKEEKKFLEHIATCDKTWDYGHPAESKRPPPKRFIAAARWQDDGVRMLKL